MELKRTCSAESCSLCSDAIDKGVVLIDRSGVVHTWFDPGTHLRLGPTVIPDPPNRFDPFEALDTIIERAEEIEEQNHETPDVMACIGRLADIRGEVHALRAYITGMGR